MLTYLLYISNRKSNCTDAEMEKILISCNKNNPSAKTTGLLLYSNTKFIQYVEGEYSKIMPLYDKIKTDDRHENVILLGLGVINKKIFPNWHMGRKEVSNQEIEYLTEINKDEKEVFESVLQGNEKQGKRVQAALNTLFS